MPSVDIRTDTPALIREVQQHLRTLALSDDRLPLIAVDGIYGADTADAVGKFQELSGLSPTGEVDPLTWEQLYLACCALHESRRVPCMLQAFPSPEHTVHPGDECPTASFLQLMLCALSRRYASVPSVALSGVYDKATVRSMRELRRVCDLPAGDTVDLDVWDAVAGLYNDVTGGA